MSNEGQRGTRRLCFQGLVALGCLRPDARIKNEARREQPRFQNKPERDSLLHRLFVLRKSDGFEDRLTPGNATANTAKLETGRRREDECGPRIIQITKLHAPRSMYAVALGSVTGINGPRRSSPLEMSFLSSRLEAAESISRSSPTRMSRYRSHRIGTIY